MNTPDTIYAKALQLIDDNIPENKLINTAAFLINAVLECSFPFKISIPFELPGIEGRIKLTSKRATTGSIHIVITLKPSNTLNGDLDRSAEYLASFIKLADMIHQETSTYFSAPVVIHTYTN